MDRKYKLPTKRKGESKVRLNQRIDPDFKEALRIFAANESEREGLKISVMTVLMTGALENYKELRVIYKQLKKERNDAIRKGRVRT